MLQTIRHRADIYYQLWKLNPVETDNRDEALRLYQSLFEKTGEQECRRRIEELSVAANIPPQINEPTTAEKTERINS